jgi:LytS/YehU family sensor histidine kinase
MIVHLSELLRRSLESDAGTQVPLARELDFVRSYLALASMRHGERLRAEITIPSALTTARVPSLILQPLIENAVMHGVERTPGPCRVAVRARLAGEQLLIEVENDLPAEGAPERRGSGVGLENVRARLAQHYGDHGRFALDLEPSRRAVAKLMLPFTEGPARRSGPENNLLEETA